MPLDTTIKKVLIIGSGPIIIGQACEFDYSGTQACKALRDEGIEVALINSNPATIMTDPSTADQTYIEPLTLEAAQRVLEKERPCGILPTLGGQTGLNLGMELHKSGILKKLGIRMLGAEPEVIERAENRQVFKDIVKRIGLDVPKSGVAHSIDEARAIRADIGLPAIIRPSFTLGGSGGGIAYNIDEYDSICESGIRMSPTSEILIEESCLGWKEYELEVMRDNKDNVVIVCSIENIDPMGVHTGDSITVAPSLTLSDREYQRMRDAALAIIREVGVETGGSNIQFAVNPATGRQIVIEMNPRVSRSSALASKATGFPIAKFAAKLAVGYTLDELQNDITKETPASFEPSIDYIVTKWPRFAFEKFPGEAPILTTRMKSVGEAMAIGRTFKQSFQKALRSLEIDSNGYGLNPKDPFTPDQEDYQPLNRREIRSALVEPNPDRLFAVRQAFLTGWTVEQIHQESKIDPWFLSEFEELSFEGFELYNRRGETLDDIGPEEIRRLKDLGFSDCQIAHGLGLTELDVRVWRKAKKVTPIYKTVDTCAGEFKASTPYLYSSYDGVSDDTPTNRKKVIILGSGPNRIGQGIEFDYCCVHASMALADEGYETIMVNSNPETVSTDYDTSDRLYFEPLTLESVLDIYDREQPIGLIVQLGGQTPLNLTHSLVQAGCTILGTSSESIDAAEDRDQFQKIIKQEGLLQPANEICYTVEGALATAHNVGYPMVVRPSFVLGGRAMRIVYGDDELKEYVSRAVEASPNRAILMDKFLQDAIEVDVDALCDGTDVVIGGIMEHIEEAGIHSGDSSSVLPPYTLTALILDRMREQTRKLAFALKVKGLMNIQFAVRENDVYIIEVNPRASRTVPFVSKAIGRPLAQIAARIAVGRTLAELDALDEKHPRVVAIKKSVFPWNRFPSADILLGPEMRSTGEVMGHSRDFGWAFAKAQAGGGEDLPQKGCVFLSVRDRDKPHFIFQARKLLDLGFEIAATPGTYNFLKMNGIEPVRLVHRIHGGRPNVLDLMKNGEIQLVVNVPEIGRRALDDDRTIRGLAIERGTPVITTVAGAAAAVSGMEVLVKKTMKVTSIQETYLRQGPPRASGSWTQHARR
jgi:carbamoyl-phosphate synthase large subunit